jgi:glycosyltransferase involved in cell wall biosynthesis
LKELKNSDVSVIIPTLNEEGTIAEVIQQVNQMGYHSIMVVDGNSKDRTVQIAKDLGVEVIVQNGKGKGAALRQVFNHDGLNGDAIVMMDADGSMDPEEIPGLIKALNSESDLAKGARFLSHGYSEDMNLIRRIGNLLFVLLVNCFWSANYKDLCYGFAAFRKPAINKLYPRLRSKNFEIEAEIFIKARKLGLKVVEVPSVEYRRKYGKSNLKAFRDGLRILKTIIREFIHPSS